MEGKSKNPREIAYIVEKNTFAVFDGLSEAQIENEEEPLTLHSRKFSRFSFLIINAEKKAVTANINVRDIFGLISKSKVAMQQEILQQMTSSADPKETEELSSAYTVTISSGVLKGRTPAEVLITDGEKGIQALQNQYLFLRENVGKYPKNKTQMDAIMEASKLLKEGKLNKETCEKNKSNCFSLYSSGLKPLVRKTDNQGRCFVYEISIDWHFGEARPVTVHIKNFYAPVVKKENGLFNVQASKLDTVTQKDNYMNLTYDDWAYVLHMIETDIERFESSIYGKKRKESDRYEYENKQAAKGTTVRVVS